MSEPLSALVIGAGFAGMAAARALIDRRVEVTVLEARDRTGGRVHAEDGFDYGAGWIHGTEGNPIANLARMLDHAPIFVGGDSTYTGGWDGLSLPGLGKADKDESLIAADRALDRAFGIATHAEQDLSLEQALELALGELALEPAAEADARWHMSLLARDDIGEEPSRISAREWDNGYELFGYGDSVIPGGIGAFGQMLAVGLPIAFGAEVTSLAYGSGGVLAQTADGRTWRADRAVVTLPLGVLKADTVRFVPALPADKRDAIGRLGVGALAKIGLRFPAIAWPERQYCFSLPPGQGRGATIVVNRAAIDRVPELIVYCGGDRGRELEAMTEAETLEWAMAELATLFGFVLPRPVAIRRSAWTRDRYALGCYAHVPVGAKASDFDTLAAPVGDRLFFAGEATSSDQWATIHGAWRSGLRAAAELTGDWSVVPRAHFTENRRWRSQMMRANRFLALGRAAIPPAEVQARVALLASCEIFATIDRADLGALALMFVERAVPKGAVLCRQDDPAAEAWLIREGELAVHVDGAKRATAVLGPGSLSGEYGLFRDARRTATLKATAETRLLALDYARFERFLLAYPQATLALLKVALGR